MSINHSSLTILNRQSNHHELSVAINFTIYLTIYFTIYLTIPKPSVNQPFTTIKQQPRLLTINERTRWPLRITVRRCISHRDAAGAGELHGPMISTGDGQLHSAMVARPGRRSGELKWWFVEVINGWWLVDG